MSKYIGGDSEIDYEKIEEQEKKENWWLIELIKEIWDTLWQRN